MRKVVVFGTFDILHRGHIHMLKQAKRYGDHLTVVIARDKTVKEVKGKNPKNSEKIRLERVKNSKLADEVLLGSLGNKYEIIKKIKPEVVALGYDQEAFTEKLSEAIGDKIRIARLSSHRPEKYKTSKLL